MFLFFCIDVWQRPTRRTRTDSQYVYFEIPYARILPTPAETTPVNTKKHVIYDVCVHHDTEQDTDNDLTIVERRYTHFLSLYEALRKDNLQLMQNVIFPKKVLMGNFSAELIAERSAAFEAFLDYIVSIPALRDSAHFLEFLQGEELKRACQLLDERRNEYAVPILENSFRILNKIFLDKSKCVLLLLCRLVAACTTSPLPHPSAEKWAELALRRYEHVCDTEMLVLYIPLLQTCQHLWWQRGRDRAFLDERLTEMGRKGIKIKGVPSLAQAIHALEPRAEIS